MKSEYPSASSLENDSEISSKFLWYSTCGVQSIVTVAEGRKSGVSEAAPYCTMRNDFSREMNASASTRCRVASASPSPLSMTACESCVAHTSLMEESVHATDWQ